MAHAHLPDAWHDLYVMLGTSSAALLGLLFVATSLHLDEIVNNPIYRLRARNLMLHLIVTLLQAAAILTPQPVGALGVELLVLSLCGLWFPLSLTLMAIFKPAPLRRGNFSIYRAFGYVAGYLFAIVGSVALLREMDWGMHLVTLSYALSLVSAVWNAWMLMIGVGETEKTNPG